MVRTDPGSDAELCYELCKSIVWLPFIFCLVFPLFLFVYVPLFHFQNRFSSSCVFSFHCLFLHVRPAYVRCLAFFYYLFSILFLLYCWSSFVSLASHIYLAAAFVLPSSPVPHRPPLLSPGSVSSLICLACLSLHFIMTSSAYAPYPPPSLYLPFLLLTFSPPLSFHYYITVCPLPLRQPPPLASFCL